MTAERYIAQVQLLLRAIPKIAREEDKFPRGLLSRV
jgi:hypothetical protein